MGDTKLIETLLEMLNNAGYNADRSNLKINIDRIIYDNTSMKTKEEFILRLLDPNGYHDITEDNKQCLTIMVGRGVDYWDGL